MDKKQQEIERIVKHLKNSNVNVPEELKRNLSENIGSFSISNKKLDAIITSVNEWKPYIIENEFQRFFEKACCYGVSAMLKIHAFALDYKTITTKLSFGYINDNLPLGFTTVVTENDGVLVKSQNNKKLI